MEQKFSIGKTFQAGHEAQSTRRGDLTQRQRSIVEFIDRFWRSCGYPPSVRDIVAGCCLSSTSVADYNLKVLEKKGFISRRHGVSRGIGLPGGARTEVPVIGTIAAGQPIPVPDHEAWDITRFAERLQVPPQMLQGREGVYALRVKGHSMIDALIGDGDIVLMQHVNSVENGDLAAVWLKDEKEATLKKFYAERGRVRLQPANSGMRPIYTPAANVLVQGRVIGVVRNLG
ncbi:MAG: transcriptional repressor LexA [Dehalococcoidia bacterium]|nr:transcriptional repressor LexA [Dehalococcoidia bacterium]